MKNLSYKTLLKYLFAFITLFVSDNIVGGVPLSLAMYSALCQTVFSPIPTFFIYGGVIFLRYPMQNAMLLCVSAVILAIIFYIYKLKKRRVKFELVIYFTLALIPYLLGNFNNTFYEKLVYSTVIGLFAFILPQALELVFVKKMTKRAEISELAALYIAIFYFSLGALNICGVTVWTDAALIIMLTLCFFYKSPRAFIPAFILPLAIAVYTQSLEILAIFEIYCAAVLIFAKYSRLLSALALIITQTVFVIFSGNIFSYSVTDYITLFAPSAIFLFIPNGFYNLMQKNLIKFDEPEITRDLVNAERADVSAKLYNIADVFKNIEGALSSLNTLSPDRSQVTDKIYDELVCKVCSQCSNHTQCAMKGAPKQEDIDKMITLCFSKGKLTLTDVSRDLSSYCFCIGEMVTELNRIVGNYEQLLNKRELALSGKKLITMHAGATAELMKNIAFTYAAKIDFGNKEEKELFYALTLEGIVPDKVVKFCNEYHIIFSKQAIKYTKTASCISAFAGKKYRLIRKTHLGYGILAVYGVAPLYDACFGISQKTKDGSKISGDNYCLRKIDEGRFIIALCDGMGSGEKANASSLTTINLIENFYAAKLDDDVITEITNTLISTCFDDSFSSLDCAIIDLYAAKCNILKVGATFGFLISQDKIIIIENNSLPLGISDEVVPTTYSYNLFDGDMLIIMSDGITDAFFSSTDTIDFLQREKTLNPQDFADKILNYALALNENVAKDDMSVLAIKLYNH